jgi:hypothetical protein
MFRRLYYPHALWDRPVRPEGRGRVRLRIYF